MFAGKRYVILGAARQGKALAAFVAARGARVILNDAQPREKVDLSGLENSAGIETVFGAHPLELLDACDVLCLSGGVPIDLPIVLEARRRGIPLSNDAQIFFELCPAPIIGITGSAGKTTTTTLVGEILKNAESRVPNSEQSSDAGLGTRRSVWVGGNIGNPLIGDLLRIQPTDRVVIELSSFQLEQMTRSPHIACITNITPNHLDRHGTMDAYVAAKKRIIDFQTAGDVQVLCADDPVSRALNTAARTIWFSLNDEPAGEGAWMDDAGFLRVRAGGIDGAICHRRELQLMGVHNIVNVLAASAICAAAGAPIEAMRAVATSFKGVAHRLQWVGEINGARYYDDSIATAPERLIAALRCFEQPVILLCGGRDKHLPWADAAAQMRARCKRVVLFGEMAPMVADALRAAGVDAAAVTRCDTLEQAVEAARAAALPGDVVLLSPGGTSYDAYKDFAQRGDHFSQLVTLSATRG